MSFNLITITEESELRHLEKESTFTWEGMNIDSENLKAVCEGLEKDLKEEVTFYTWTGDFMNKVYGLTGRNRYPKDLSFLSIDWDSFKSEVGRIAKLKMEVGARWLDDIVDNNAYRERH